MDQLEQRVNEFFMNAKKNKQEWREEQMTSIKKVRLRQSVVKPDETSKPDSFIVFDAIPGCRLEKKCLVNLIS